MIIRRAFLLLLLVGCAEAHQGPPVPVGISGTLLFQTGSLMFKPCGATLPSPLRDDTGRDLPGLVAGLGYGADSIQAHLVVEDGVAREVRVAAPEAVGCEGLLPEGDFQARGNEPFWLVTIQDDRAIWRSPEEMDGVEYLDGVWTELPGGWRFEAVAHPARPSTPHSGRPVDPVWIVFRDESCIDSMSGARFPFVTEVRRGDLRASGCGSEGRRP